MQGELSLGGIAEISIALAGFSGLVAMVRRKIGASSGISGASDGYRFSQDATGQGSQGLPRAG